MFQNWKISFSSQCPYVILRFFLSSHLIKENITDQFPVIQLPNSPFNLIMLYLHLTFFLFFYSDHCNNQRLFWKHFIKWRDEVQTLPLYSIGKQDKQYFLAVYFVIIEMVWMWNRWDKEVEICFWWWVSCGVIESVEW